MNRTKTNRRPSRLLALCLSLVLSLGLSSPALAAGEDSQGGSIGGVYEMQVGESGKSDTNLKVYNENDPSSYSDSVRWTLEDGVVTISGQGTTADFGASPFNGNSDVEAVVIEEGVTNLGLCIFQDMPNLRAVILMDAATTFDAAFAGDFPSLEAVIVGADLEGGAYTTPNLVRAEAVEAKILPLTREVLLEHGLENGILADDSDIYLAYGEENILVMEDGKRISSSINGVERQYWFRVENANVRFLPFEDILAMARRVVQDLPAAAQAVLPAELTNGSTAVIPDPEDPDQTEDPGQNTDPAAPEDITETTQAVANGLTHLRTSYSENDYLDLSISGSTLTVSGRILADGLRQVRVRCGSGIGYTVDAASEEYFSVQLSLSFSGRQPVDVYTNRGGGSTFSSYIYDRILIQNTGSGYQIMPSLVLENNEKFNSIDIDPQSLLSQEVPAPVAAMSDQIVGSETDPYTQVFLLHQWAAENIAYDYTMLSGATTYVTDSAGVLELRRSVCQGYAELLRDLILAQNIPAMFCGNSALSGSYALTTTGGEGHAHVEAYVNGRWVVMDPTWDSQNKYYGPGNQEWESPNGYYYFDITPEAFAMDHLITARGGINGVTDDSGFVIGDNFSDLIRYEGPGGVVVIPEGIKMIASDVFSGRTDITAVILPEGLETIWDSAFSGCTGLTEVRIPDSVTLISGYAFNGCTGLTSLKLPAGNTCVIQGNAFAGCTGLRSLTLPGNIQLNGTGVFEGAGLRTVVVEEGVTDLNLGTFLNSPELVAVQLPASLRQIHMSVFSSDDRKVTAPLQVYYMGTETQWANVEILAGNDLLEDAVFHFGETMPANLEDTVPEESQLPDEPVISSWAEGYVLQSEELGLIPDEVLGSDYTRSITRAQFAALAVQTYETMTGQTPSLDLQAGDATFADSRGNLSIAKAYNLGILNGYNSAGSRAEIQVGPNDLITREQAAAILARLNEVLGQPLTAAERLPFTDSISDWARDGVSRVYQAGIMTGTGADTFGAAENYTIEQAIVTMYRTYQF